MRRVFPHPFLAGLLLVLWLVLQQSAGLGHILMGGVIAIFASWAANAVVPEPVRARKPLKVLWLVALVGADIIRSNLAVLFILLHPRPKPKAGFVLVKLELTNSFALAILGVIVTATPGSAWLEHDRERSTVLIHVFDLMDPEEWAHTIKTRYESLLMEIFQ